MRKSIFLTGMLVILLTFALMLTGCDTGSGAGNGGGGGAAGVTDPALNGVWGERWDNQFWPFFIFNNGNFELFGDSTFTGTYTTSGNNLTLRFTHIRPDGLAGVPSPGLTIAEFREFVLSIGEWESVQWVDRYLLHPQTLTYFISGNTLTLIGDIVDGVMVLHRP